MFNNKLPFLAATVCTVAVVATGCGGHSGTSETVTNVPISSSVPSGRGQVAVSIRWPEQIVETSAASRDIPAATGSLFFELTEVATGTKYPFVVRRPNSRPGVQTVTFDQFLPVGEYILSCAARPGNGSFNLGQGSTLAIAAARLTVTEGKTTKVPLTLESAIARLTSWVTDVSNNFNGIPLSQIRAGRRVLLVVEAHNAADELIVGSQIEIDRVRLDIVEGADSIVADPFNKERTAVRDLQFDTVRTGAVRLRIRLRDKPAVASECSFAVVGDTVITPESGSLLPLFVRGQQPTQLTAAQRGNSPDLGSPPIYIWESLTPEIATITPGGLFTGIAKGYAKVRVTTTEGQLPRGAALTAEYDLPVGDLSSIAIVNSPAALDSGQTVTLKANVSLTVTPSYTPTQDSPIQWSIVDGGAYASIDPVTGVLQARSANDGAHTVRVRATFPLTGATTEASIVINSYGGVNVGVD